jgi:hypothetical protein
MARTSSPLKVGLIAPEGSGKAVREALEGARTRLVWARGREAWRADVVLWIVDVSAGIPAGTRERFRTALEAVEAPPLVVYLEGTDRAETLLPKLIELGVRELLADLGVDADAVPVLGGAVRELSSVLARAAGGSAHSFSLEADSLGVARDVSERSETPEAWIVPVFYGTDRNRTRSKEPARVFGGGRGSLSFGYVEVSLPKRRDKGEMPAPSWWKPWRRSCSWPGCGRR